MATTKLSSKGQVNIPKSVCIAHLWRPGQKLKVIDTDDGILLKPLTPFAETTLAEVASCLKYQCRPKSMSEMGAAIRRGATKSAHDRD